MRDAVEIVGVVNLVLFTAIAAVCLRYWWRQRSATAFWAAAAFVALALVVASRYVVPAEPETLAERGAQRLVIGLGLLFPYFLYRFAAAFRPSHRPFARAVDTISVLLVAGTAALPSIPAEGAAWPWWFTLYVAGFVLHWAALLLIVSVQLWRASRIEASVARRRMQMLAFASTTLIAALLLNIGNGEQEGGFELAVRLLAGLSALGFLLGFAPPWWLRGVWRRPEQERMQLATGGLMAATTVDDVAARVLPPMASIVGAVGVALEDADGNVIARHGKLEEQPNGDVRRLAFPFGSLAVRTSAFAPFFGDEERKLLTALGSLTSLALDRARLFSQERDARHALEQADRLKSEFVALAAHELRSPVGAIYGLSETIAERSDVLGADQLAELQASLTQQIRRLRELVEQLLDLSRLDADAVQITPRRVKVRDRLTDIVGAVVPLEATQISIEADAALEADVDVDALERIVSNLVVNACRYGAPPVRVTAEERDGALQVVVEDSGPGVPAEFVPQLFDRFARSADSAATVTGTGLGLAIARSYARAHAGEVRYRPAAPRGAAFEVTLPATTAA